MTFKYQPIYLLVLSTVFSGSAWAGAAEPGKPVEKSDRFEDRATESRTAMQSVNRISEERDISRLVSVPREDIVRVLKELQSSPQENLSLKSMLHRVAKAGSSPEAATDVSLVKAYVRLMSSAPGEFHLKPTELESRLSSWSPAAKAKLAQVLERAQLLAKQNQAATREDAFELALKKEGLDEKYKKRCRLPQKGA